MARAWTTLQVAKLRELWGREYRTEIGRVLGRSPEAVGVMARKLGLPRKQYAVVTPSLCRAISERHAAGLNDADIAAQVGCHANTVYSVRKRLGLKSNAFNARHRARMADRVKRWCRRYGAGSLADVRHSIERLAVHAAGWPAGTTMRQARILDAIEAGPKTRDEIRCRRAGGCSAWSTLVKKKWVAVVARRGRCRVYGLAIARRHSSERGAA